MVNLNDASKENSNLSYYGLFFGFLTLAFAIYLGGTKYVRQDGDGHFTRCQCCCVFGGGAGRANAT